jgi:hypothetical protein
VGLVGQTCKLGHYDVTPQEAEDAILDFLRDAPGRLFNQWYVLNRICVHPGRDMLRLEKQFYLKQLSRLIQERKVVRYRRGLQRGKIRISEAFV